MKRSMMIGLATMLAGTLALAGCGGGTSEDGSSKVTKPAGKDAKAEITYALWDETQLGFVNKNIADFNKEYPGIKVTVSLTPVKQYQQKLLTQAEGNNLPDVFWMNGPNIQLYSNGGQLASLDGLDIDWKNYPEALVDIYSDKGVHYGVPKDFDTVALWYNKAIFEKAGVALPTDNWSWDDFTKAANEISTKLKSEGIYGVTADLSSGQESYYNTILQTGGYIIKDGKSGYDDPKTIEGLKFWSDLIKSGAMPSVQVLTDNQPRDIFTSGRAAMMWAGTWQTAVFAKSDLNPTDLNVVDLPKKAHKATVIHGLANVAAAKGKNLAASLAFVQFLGSKQAAETEGAAGTTIPAFNGTQEKYVDSYPNWNVSAYLKGAKEFAKPYPVSKNTSVWGNQESKILGQGFAGALPIEEAAKQLAKQMNESLAKEGK